MNDAKVELETIQIFLEQPVSEELSLVVERGNELMIIIARSGYMMAEAKKTLNERMQSEVFESLKQIAKETPFATSRTVNALIDSLCREERFIYDWCERINKTATHQIEYCRTLISLAKQELYNNRPIENTRI